jgi:hypothetical protein
VKDDAEIIGGHFHDLRLPKPFLSRACRNIVEIADAPRRVARAKAPVELCVAERSVRAAASVWTV